MPCTVELSPAAARQLKKLPENVRGAIARKIDLLADVPRPTGCEKLAGYPDLSGCASETTASSTGSRIDWCWCSC